MDYLIEIRDRAAGRLFLYTNKIVVSLYSFYTEESLSELLHEAKLTAALANKPVPVEVEEE